MQGDAAPAYLTQLARSYRFRERYASIELSREILGGNSFNGLEDFLWASFQSILHVKEWIRSDSTIEKRLAQAVIATAETTEAALECRPQFGRCRE